MAKVAKSDIRMGLAAYQALQQFSPPIARSSTQFRAVILHECETARDRDCAVSGTIPNFRLSRGYIALRFRL